jgi:dTDP-4-dehydrorhamnose reductase
MRLLILGAAGLLGNSLYRYFAEETSLEVFGTVRRSSLSHVTSEPLQSNLISDVDVLNQATLLQTFERFAPDVVINCTGLTKHRRDGEDRLAAIALNSLLPHQLAALCETYKARLIHFSTDCVFTGKKGLYKEADFADAEDVYGRSKWLGEVDYPHAVTLRTSMIGPELGTAYGLLEWFLSQKTRCKGFRQAVFSGLPTIELAQVIHGHVLSNKDLSGVYHVSAKAINKYDLLKIIAEVYEKHIEIEADDTLVIDRSLDSERFQTVTGYSPPDWRTLIEKMHNAHKKVDANV